MKENLHKSWTSGLKWGACLLLGVCALAALPAQAAPLATPLSLAAPASAALPGLTLVRDCAEGCADCNDCPTEIDFGPPRPHDDPIGREIQRSRPVSLDPCERKNVVTDPRRTRLDYDACGIRCWYWRLRHGYCGPGCDYYRYRMHDFGKEPFHRRASHACKS